MFDLTQEIKLNASFHNSYKKLQLILYGGAIILAFYLFFTIIFPTQYFTFSFLNPNSTKNNIINPRFQDGMFLANGKLENGKISLFEAAIDGNYSQAKVDIILSKKSDPLDTAEISLQKSYQSFFYPEGKTWGFKDGSLLQEENNYYLVSQKKLRKFQGEKIWSTLGFDKKAFREITKNDLTFNEMGEEIRDTSFYPENSIFKIEDTYYILENQKLHKFISPQAYLTHYDDAQAIRREKEFLLQFPAISENELIGFSDGTLISYGISAYIVSSGKILPVNNIFTFSSMGYAWADVISASGDEISLYEKDKLFTLSSAHPDGTIFVTTEDSQWYIVSQNEKHRLPSEGIARSWLKKNPILVSEESLSIKESCQLEDTSLFSNHRYSCSFPLEKFQKVLGKDYQFKLVADSNLDIDNIEISFNKAINWPNLKSTLKEILVRTKNNYVAPTSQ